MAIGANPPSKRKPMLNRDRQQAFTIAGAAVFALIAGRLVLGLFRGKPRECLYGLKFRMNLTSTQISKLADDIISRSTKIYDLVAAVPLDKVTYENVVAPLATLEAEEFALMQSCKFPRLVSTSKDIREASLEAEKKLDAHEVKRSMRVDVYSVVKTFAQKKEQLEPEAQRYVTHLIRDYERLGLHLNAEVRNKVERLKTRIGELCIVFQNNLSEDNTALSFSEEELAGLPIDFIESLECEEDGRRKVTLKPPHYFQIMDQCKVRSTRFAIAVARNKRCIKENVPILEKALELRHQLAQLLGYASWAEYALDVRMAGKPAKVKEFHDEILTKITPAAEKELQILRALKEIEEKDQDLGMEDIRYYMHKAEEQAVGFNHDQVREYFPIEVVTSGLFRIYQDILGLNFMQIKEAQVWHPEVQLFSVSDAGSGELMGYFYLDLYPRDHKFTNACVTPLQPGCIVGNGRWQLPVAALLINLTKPTKEKPSLLMHSEVNTYFHEFGHVMHHICSHTSFARFSGLRVETDFVEAPSQLIENWCYERDSLKLMSGYYKDQQKAISNDICDMLEQKRKLFPALRTLQNQIFLGIFDQMVHSMDNVNTESILKQIHPQVVLGIPMLEGTNLAASLLHLMTGGYDAVCYGYLWSEVFAADMFESKFKGNVLSNSSGKEYRNKVLAPGASKDAIDILRGFLGREPSLDAYLRLKGIVSA